MQADPAQTQKLLREYTALAQSYERRWSGYLDASLGMTLEAVVGASADRVLDVGCGTGLLLEALDAEIEIQESFGIDSVPAMLDIATRRDNQRATFLQADVAMLPFDSAHFDLVTCTNALHYFVDVDAALREIQRVLSPSGSLIVTDWCRDYFWMKLLNRILPRTRHAHSHTFGSAELEQSLMRNGFREIRICKRKIDRFWGLMRAQASAVEAAFLPPD